MNIGAYMPAVLARTMVTNQCWIWLGSRTTKGYGQVCRGGTHMQVHRIAYESEHGPIPDGLVIDHLCHNPAVCAGGTCAHRLCVNPAHLIAVTNEANLRRQTPAAKTHCVRGHEYTPENTFRNRNGRRNCRTCHTQQMRDYRETVHTVEPTLVRQWAIANGLPVGPRGALSKALIADWNAAHPDQLYQVIKPEPLTEAPAA